MATSVECNQNKSPRGLTISQLKPGVLYESISQTYHGNVYFIVQNEFKENVSLLFAYGNTPPAITDRQTDDEFLECSAGTKLVIEN